MRFCFQMKIFFSFLFFCFFSTSAFSGGNFKVVIDPGHGGKDSGTLRGTHVEKKIVLAIGLAFGELIEKNMSDVEVLYTRKTDVTVPLDKRAAVGNKNKANLFISIHVNSTPGKTTTANGVETYALGFSKSEASMAVAQRENEVIKYEDNYKQRYEGFDPDSPESYIIFEFMTNEFLNQSLEFAGMIQGKMKTIAKRQDRGARQGNLLVLRESGMPAVLVEVGFINNTADAKYITSTSGQKKIAESLFAAFKEYKNKYDIRQGKIVDTSVSKPSQVAPKSQKSDSQIKKGEIEYRVQFLYSREKLNPNSAKLKGISNVSFYKEGNGYKYTAGSTTDFQEALKLQSQIKKRYKDAFVVRFKNGKRQK